jgi:uncharacterized protein (DUF2336 family)
MTRLSELAADPQSARRGDIYLAIASLYQSQAARLSEHERALMREILQRLAGEVEMAIRIALAERLAGDDSAPLDLILLLTDDRIEVARPLILRSRQIGDAELLSLLDHVGEDHQTACAERPHLGAPVCDALARNASETVLVALLRNETARIAPETFVTLVEKSRQILALQDPLVHRGDLPRPLANRMCDWVSETLKAHIRASYPAVAPTAEPELETAAQSIQTPAAPAVGEAGTGTIKLVEKLAAAGQLRAGFLLRVLHQGQTDMFEHAFAKLLDLDANQLRHILYQGSAVPVALACRAVGIDRCVFPTVFNLSRQAHGSPQNLAGADKDQVESVFKELSKADAHNRVLELAQAAN